MAKALLQEGQEAATRGAPLSPMEIRNTITSINPKLPKENETQCFGFPRRNLRSWKTRKDREGEQPKKEARHEAGMEDEQRKPAKRGCSLQRVLRQGQKNLEADEENRRDSETGTTPTQILGRVVQ